MSRTTFENYGRSAQEETDLTIVSGRYAIQRRAERLVFMDVAKKLDIGPDDRLLEIGCGPGNLLIPLSFLVKSAIGIDHPEVCRRLKARFTDDKVLTIGCNFLDYVPDADAAFDKVLIYSVINTLSDQNEAVGFMDKAVGLLAPGGRLLLGDIANADRKNRFMNSPAGKRFEIEWREEMATAEPNAESEHPRDEMMFQPTDGFVLSLMDRYRGQGFEAHLLSQPPVLPFGHTREDILIRRLPD